MRDHPTEPARPEPQPSPASPDPRPVAKLLDDYLAQLTITAAIVKALQ